MNRFEDSNISETEQESNTLIRKIEQIAKRLKMIRAAEIIPEDCAFAQELMTIAGDAKITLGIFTGPTIKTITISKEGVKLHEEPCRSRTVDCIKANS